MKDLIKLGLWDDDMRKRLIIENGSVLNIDVIPEHLKKIYKTAFEIKQMHIVRQAINRGRFIDQAQSLNLFLAEPDFDILTSALFDAHDGGNKTGIYYYRSLPAINPINFGIDVDDIKRLTGRNVTKDVLVGGYNIATIGTTVEATVGTIIGTTVGTTVGVTMGTSMGITCVSNEPPLKQDVKSDIIKKTTSKKISKDVTIVEPEMYCKLIPGRKIEECTMCGS
jgi:ribonucleotide reductase alpha subunit